jgi:hypothetical protein
MEVQGLKFQKQNLDGEIEACHSLNERRLFLFQF